MAYRQADGKSNRLTFGTYPEVSLAEARAKRAAARTQRADGLDPAQVKRDQKVAKTSTEVHTFEAVAREWLRKTAAYRAATTQARNVSWPEKNIFPAIGAMPISAIKPRDVLTALQKIEARGAIESAHKIKQLCGQIFRFGVSNDWTERDVTADLLGALSAVPQAHYASIIEPKEVATLLRAMYSYAGHPYCTAALRLAPMVFPAARRAARDGMGRARPGCRGVAHPRR